MITIRAVHHLDASLIARLPEKLRELVFAAEWSLEVVAVPARSGGERELHIECRLQGNEAARKLESHLHPDLPAPPAPL